jgi:RHS repeat-associated protein
VKKHVYSDNDIMSWRAKRGNLPITGIDGVRQSDPISGEVAWQEKSYTVSGAGPHTLKWCYTKDGSGSEGHDCGYVDWVQWTGTMTEPDPNAWITQVNYAYDAFGRRVEKKYDGRTVLKYLYDGDHCIAEYGAGNDLHRKYIYGPPVDEPVCMVESSGTYAGTYYYHFDGLGSVTALTNSSGTTVEVYEYDVYGRPGASVPAHPNRIMFTGREYDKETGLYYYRARYYNPQIGRFLQTDPIGYKDGMDWYTYCGNNPITTSDPSGLFKYIWSSNVTPEDRIRIVAGFDAVAARCDQRIAEIDQILASMTCDANDPMRKELKEVRAILCKERDGIRSEYRQIEIDIRTRIDLFRKLDEPAAYVTNPFKRNGTMILNKNNWPMNPIDLGNKLMHELGHWAGQPDETKKDIESGKGHEALGGWNPGENAAWLDDFWPGDVQTQTMFRAYRVKHPECFGGCSCAPGQSPTRTCPIHGDQKK